MKVAAIICIVLAVIFGIGGLSNMNMEGKEGARAAGFMIGTLLFPAIFAVVGILLWKKASKAEQIS